VPSLNIPYIKYERIICNSSVVPLNHRDFVGPKELMRSYVNLGSHVFMLYLQWLHLLALIFLQVSLSGNFLAADI